MSKQEYKIIEKIKEIGGEVSVYDPEPFRMDKFFKTYCFPFKRLDERYGCIEWHLEPRKFKWSQGMKRYYITQVLLWASQTIDPRYANKVFGIDCFTEGIGGISHKRNDYEEGLVNQSWHVSVSSYTKTIIFSTYPNDKFDLLCINASSSVYMDAVFLRSDKMDQSVYYSEIKKRLGQNVTL